MYAFAHDSDVSAIPILVGETTDWRRKLSPCWPVVKSGEFSLCPPPMSATIKRKGASRLNFQIFDGETTFLSMQHAFYFAWTRHQLMLRRQYERALISAEDIEPFNKISQAHAKLLFHKETNKTYLQTVYDAMRPENPFRSKGWCLKLMNSVMLELVRSRVSVDREYVDLLKTVYADSTLRANLTFREHGTRPYWGSTASGSGFNILRHMMLHVAREVVSEDVETVKDLETVLMDAVVLPAAKETYNVCKANLAIKSAMSRSPDGRKRLKTGKHTTFATLPHPTTVPGEGFFDFDDLESRDAIVYARREVADKHMPTSSSVLVDDFIRYYPVTGIIVVSGRVEAITISADDAKKLVRVKRESIIETEAFDHIYRYVRTKDLAQQFARDKSGAADSRFEVADLESLGVLSQMKNLPKMCLRAPDGKIVYLLPETAGFVYQYIGGGKYIWILKSLVSARDEIFHLHRSSLFNNLSELNFVKTEQQSSGWLRRMVEHDIFLSRPDMKDERPKYTLQFL